MRSRHSADSPSLCGFAHVGTQGRKTAQGGSALRLTFPEYQAKRHRVVGFWRKDAKPDNQCDSVYRLVADETSEQDCDMAFVDTHIDEAIEAFQQGWIDLGSVIPPNRNRVQ